MKFIFQPGKMSITGGGIDGFLELNKSSKAYLLNCYPSIETPSNSLNKDLVIKWVFDLIHNDYSAHNHTINYYYEIVNQGTFYNQEDLKIIIYETFLMFKKEVDGFLSHIEHALRLSSLSDSEVFVVQNHLNEALLPLIEFRDI